MKEQDEKVKAKGMIIVKEIDNDVFPKQKKSLKKEKGFTLMEILLVVAIIGLLASLILPNLMGRYERSKEEVAKVQVELLSSAVQSFILDVGRCPNGLIELVESQDPKWRGPYLGKKEIPKDPWGREYQFKCPGEHGA
ncbi:MAG: type II secretion system major pseudopilin GspG, partial [Caldimicrobium sp.]